MPLFTYRAVAQDGRMVLGKIDALNLVDLEMRLKRMDLDLVSGKPLSERNLLGSTGVPRRELIQFCFHLEMLVRSDVPILDGLGDLRAEGSGLRAHQRRQQAQVIGHRMAGGQCVESGRTVDEQIGGGQHHRRIRPDAVGGAVGDDRSCHDD